MVQRFLDPGNLPAGCPDCTRVPAALPRAVREMGYLPAIEFLQPGDLILISPLNPTRAQRGIQAIQLTGGYSAEDSQWTHAAVYLGADFAICEATVRKGVHHASLLDPLATHRVKVRRDPTLDLNSRWRIALSAALQIGIRYGWLSAARIALRAWGGLHQPQRTGTQATASLICSELFGDAYLAATGRTLLWRHQGREMSPALLSWVDDLVDVEMAWRRIPSKAA